MYGFGDMGFGMGWSWIIGLIVLAFIIWLIVRTTRQNTAVPRTYDKSPMDIL
ncbi:MAG: hypothetical protein R6U04_09850 [Bacteroidales bacterium]